MPRIHYGWLLMVLGDLVGMKQEQRLTFERNHRDFQLQLKRYKRSIDIVPNRVHRRPSRITAVVTQQLALRKSTMNKAPQTPYIYEQQNSNFDSEKLCFLKI